MIIFEEMEFETAVLENRSHIAVPVQVMTEADGGLTLLVYSFCEAIAREFEERFSADPFSEAARAFLYEKLTPIMNKIEYDTENAAGRVMRTYHITDGAELRKNDLSKQVQLLDRLTERDKATSDTELFDFEIDPDNPYDRIAVVREDGKIAAFCAVNDISETEGFYELTVECDEAHRRAGYGTACTVALAEYLLNLGSGVEYITDEHNIPSVKLAERAGFHLVRRSMPFVCYLNHFEEDEGEEF